MNQGATCQVNSLVEAAEALEARGNIERALKKYAHALEVLLTDAASSEPQDSIFRKSVAQKAEKYAARAMELKTCVESKRKETKEIGYGKSTKASGSTTVSGDSHDMDPEALEEMLKQSTLTPIGNVTMADVVGHNELKMRVKEAIVLPFVFPELYTGQGQPRAALMFGPPGNGKTTIAKAAAHAANAASNEGCQKVQFFSVSCTDLTSAYVGESGKRVKAFFSMIRKNKPCLVFIDELEAIFSARLAQECQSTLQAKSELLVQMNTEREDNDSVFFLGATNVPHMLDKAFVRRFQKLFYLGMPWHEHRLAILEKCLKLYPNSIVQVERKKIASFTRGYSGADIARLVSEAGLFPVRKVYTASHFTKTRIIVRCTNKACQKWHPCHDSAPGAVAVTYIELDKDSVCKPKVTYYDLLASLSKLGKTVTPESLTPYVDFCKEFSLEVDEPYAPDIAEAKTH